MPSEPCHPVACLFAHCTSAQSEHGQQTAHQPEPASVLWHVWRTETIMSLGPPYATSTEAPAEIAVRNDQGPSKTISMVSCQTCAPRAGRLCCAVAPALQQQWRTGAVSPPAVAGQSSQALTFDVCSDAIRAVSHDPKHKLTQPGHRQGAWYSVNRRPHAGQLLLKLSSAVSSWRTSQERSA